MNWLKRACWSTVLGVRCLFGRAHAQSFEAQQLLLDWQKLTQEKQLLNDLYKSYEVLSAGYGAIRDISKGSFDLHKAFLDGLLTVSPTVRKYKRISEIITLQEQMVASYRVAWTRFKQDPHFGEDELVLIGNVYSSLFDRTLKNLATLTTILMDGALRASDGERLHQIDALHADMQKHWVALQTFNNQTAMLALARTADDKDNAALKRWYGLNN